MIEVSPIPRLDANKIIRNNHYSGTVCYGTSINLGVYYNKILVGAAQFGSGVAPVASCKWVEGSTTKDYLEFNRFWISDMAPKNSESRAIGLIFKWFRKNRPDIKWLMSFADGASLKAGTIYQATNWIYTGYNKVGGLWVTKEGKRIHSTSLIGKLKDTKRDTLEAHFGKPLYRIVGGQYRYIYFLDKKWKKRLTVDPLPYPKADNIKDTIMVKKENWVKEDLWDEYIKLLSDTQ